jgi:hypothetical protein
VTVLTTVSQQVLLVHQLVTSKKAVDTSGPLDPNLPSDMLQTLKRIFEK